MEAKLRAYDVVHFRHCFDEAAQRRILSEADELAAQRWNTSLYSTEELLTAEAHQAPHAVLYHNWEAQPASVGTENAAGVALCDAAGDALREGLRHTTDEAASSQLCQALAQFVPSAVYGITYPPEGRFGAHIDGADGWVFAVSIGATATFSFAPAPPSGHVLAAMGDDAEEIVLLSGDAVFFKGGELVHSIERVQSGTEPAFFREYRLAEGGAVRFNLQFRDALHDRRAGQYTPKFFDLNPRANVTSVCANCGLAVHNTNLVMCERCRRVGYCSPTCRSQHRDAHQSACMRLAQQLQQDGQAKGASGAREVLDYVRRSFSATRTRSARLDRRPGDDDDDDDDDDDAGRAPGGPTRTPRDPDYYRRLGVERFHRMVLHRLQHCHFERTADPAIKQRYANVAAFQQLLSEVTACEAVPVAAVCQAIFDMATDGGGGGGGASGGGGGGGGGGGYLEFGVFKGDTLNFAREALAEDVVVVGVDTFSGNTHAWTNPYDVGAYSAGDHLPSGVARNVMLLKADATRMGPFFDILQHPFRVIHLDLDPYEPTYAGPSSGWIEPPSATLPMPRGERPPPSTPPLPPLAPLRPPLPSVSSHLPLTYP